MTDLFSQPEASASSVRGYQPLAYLLRPKTLDEYVGQTHLLGQGGALKKWIEADVVPSLVFWGPPGTGKTTLAHVIAHATNRKFHALSAVHAGVKDIKSAVEEAKFRLETRAQRTILFVDEIHRFTKSQQDALLPHVEDGTVTLIGATTENPSFEINAALLSRLQVLRLKSLTEDEICEILTRASRPDLGRAVLNLSPESRKFLARMADGDARRALTLFENLQSANAANSNSVSVPLDVDAVQELLKRSFARQPIRYDKAGEEHYNVISAFIKSMRDSDVDAALYYLARMIEAGEDPLFIARRMVIFASEDIGIGDFRALLVANAVRQSVEFVGMPEGRIPLAHGVVTLARAQKNNSAYLAIDKALDEVRESGALPVPLHLRNAVTKLMKTEGYGEGYVYPHDVAGSAKTTGQSHLPEGLAGKKFFKEVSPHS